MPAPSVVMQCPFCAADLTEENRVDGGRYSCPTCAPSSRIALLGWVPRAQIPITKTPESGRTHGLARVGDSWFAKNAGTGETIERQRACECGRTFNHFLLSARFLATIEKQRGRALELVKKQIPGYYVPVHCPRCERRDIGRQERIDDTRPHYTDRASAAD